MRLSRFAAAVGVAAVLLAGCGGDDGDKQTQDAKKAPATDAKQAKGTVSWCIGKDTSGSYGDAIDLYKKENPNAKVKLVELPESADEQRTQLVQRLRAKSTECDVLGLDVIWTAEFAAQGWLQDVSEVIDKRKDDFIPSTVETTTYEDKNWAVPYHTNAGFVYFRTDKAQEAPKTWEELYKQAKATDGLVYQGARYEGLTVVFLELLYGAGGKALSDDGKSVEIDSEQGRKVLTFMADGFEDGTTPKAVTTYKEQEALRAFQTGNATFMRNWPYAYALNKDSGIASKFDIAPFPKFGGGEPASVLGGINLGISAYSKNPEGASAFIDFATGPEVQKANFPNTAVSTTAPYDDPALRKDVPFAADLKKAVEQGQVRPVSPVYPQISEAIYSNVHDALQGKAEPDAALKQMKAEMEKALETF